MQAKQTLTFGSEDPSVTTRFIPCQRFTRWTFEAKAIRSWVEHHIDGRVLNACAGKSKLDHDDEVIRNDINEKIDADLHVDVAELSAYFPEGHFDTIVFDPPWSAYQSNLRYDGHNVQKDNTEFETQIDLRDLPIDTPSPEEKQQIGHARLAKDGFDYLLADDGKVIELTFHGTCMPSRLNFERQERVMFDPIGEGKAVIGSVDRNLDHQ